MIPRSQIRWQKALPEPERPDQRQGVLILGHLADISCDIHPGRIHAGLRLLERQGRSDSGLKPPLDQLVGRFSADKGLPGQLELFAVSCQGQ